MKKIRRTFYLLILVAIINFANKYSNFSSLIDTGIPNVEINEEVVIHNEKDNKVSELKDINEIDLNELKNIGFSNKKISKIRIYKEFLGSIYDIDDIYGITKEDKVNLNKNYFVSKTKFNKYNINDLKNIELRMLGFSKKEVEYVEYLKSKGKIESNIDLKDKVNNEILKRSIKFDE